MRDLCDTVRPCSGPVQWWRPHAVSVFSRERAGRAGAFEWPLVRDEALTIDPACGYLVSRAAMSTWIATRSSNITRGAVDNDLIATASAFMMASISRT